MGASPSTEKTDDRAGLPSYVMSSSFLRDPRTYSVMASLAETKQSMARVRRIMAAESERLMEAPEPFLEVPAGKT